MKLNTLNVKIEHGIPIPPRRGGNYNDLVGILRKMRNGDSVLCSQYVANSIRAVAPRIGAKVSGRTQPDKQVRIWRIK